MEWEIILYKKENKECPVLNFIQSLNAKERSKIEREIDLLEEFGLNLYFPHTRKIESNKYKGLWELRIKLATNDFRIFYFLYKDKKFILLHSIKKKTDKTPVRDLETAKARMEDYIRVRRDKDEME